MSTGCLYGTLDCGLFAVVYATEVCKGNSQADVTFNQKGCDIICNGAYSYSQCLSDGDVTKSTDKSKSTVYASCQRCMIPL